MPLPQYPKAQDFEDQTPNPLPSGAHLILPACLQSLRGLAPYLHNSNRSIKAQERSSIKSVKLQQG